MGSSAIGALLDHLSTLSQRPPRWPFADKCLWPISPILSPRGIALGAAPSQWWMEFKENSVLSTLQIRVPHEDWVSPVLLVNCLMLQSSSLLSLSCLISPHFPTVPDFTCLSSFSWNHFLSRALSLDNTASKGAKSVLVGDRCEKNLLFLCIEPIYTHRP